jgi:hypothetical protein
MEQLFELFFVFLQKKRVRKPDPCGNAQKKIVIGITISPCFLWFICAFVVKFIISDLHQNQHDKLYLCNP